MAAHKETTNKPVVVTTVHKGVFFGYIKDSQPTDVKTIRIERARNCIYWSTSVRGFMGLAASGPTKDCRVGLSVPALTLQDVNGVIEATPEAAAAWEKGFFSC